MKRKNFGIIIFVFLGLAICGFQFYSCEKKERAQVPEPSWDDFKIANVGDTWQILDENTQMMDSLNASAKAIHTITPGQRVKILKTSGPLKQWKHVETLQQYDFRGWVNADLVKKARLVETAVEAKRKQIFYELVALQDSYLKSDPFNTQKQHDAYREIAKKFNITESEVSKIGIEGIKKVWPMPRLK